MKSLHKLRGMPGFFVLWLGQAFSLLGGSMALFAVTLWTYQQTGQATSVALLGFFQFAPLVFVGLFSGALVDRYDRRLMLALGDLASLVVCLLLIVGASTGHLELWWIYTSGAVLGTFQSFQWPATSAAVTQMVDKKHYARTASLLEMAGMSSGILAPLLAGALLGFLGLPGILTLTALGSLLALSSLLFLDLPTPQSGPKAPLSRIFAEIGEGFAFVWSRPSLIALSGGARNRVAGLLVGWSGSGIVGLVVMGLGPGLGWWIAGSFLGAAPDRHVSDPAGQSSFGPAGRPCARAGSAVRGSLSAPFGRHFWHRTRCRNPGAVYNQRFGDGGSGAGGLAVLPRSRSGEAASRPPTPIHYSLIDIQIRISPSPLLPQRW